VNAQATKFVIKKQKTNNNGEKFYKQVGTVIINGTEGTGVMYLDMFDGQYRLFSGEFYDELTKEKA
jgi:hypothetical protein